MLKALVFCFAFLVVVPIGIAYARKGGRNLDNTFFAMVFFISCPIVIHMAPLPDFRGTSRGFAFYLTDFLMMMTLGGMWLNSKIKTTFFPPGWFFYWIYFGLSCVSLRNSALPLPSWFEVLKMVMMYFYFVTVYNYLVWKKSLWPLFYIILAIAVLMFAFGIKQKYITGGYYQIPSTMPHQNSLALFASMFGCVVTGILFNELQTRRDIWLGLAALAFNAVLVIFTLSRGGLACFCFGVMLTVAVSFLIGGFSVRKWRLLALLILAGSIPLSIAAPRIIHRFLFAPTASKRTRVEMALAAVRMANDKTWGVGLNNFSSKSGPQYDYSYEHYQDQTNRAALEDKQGGLVETIYLMVAAECGWITMAALLLWLLSFYLANIQNLFAYRHLPGFGVAAGIFGGLSANYIQSTMEWVLKQYHNFYQLMLIFAVISVMTYFRKRRKASLGRRQ
ncbi:MAG: hypothetical protein PHI35_04545 [Victivallaceae bacterium]|nr:hypothetical protein [Victivallaceae bacterium]